VIGLPRQPVHESGAVAAEEGERIQHAFLRAAAREEVRPRAAHLTQPDIEPFPGRAVHLAGQFRGRVEDAFPHLPGRRPQPGHVFGHLLKEIASSRKLPPAVGRLVQEGHYGVKSGRGIYEYTPERIEEQQSRRDRLFLQLVDLLHTDRSA